MSSRKDIWYTLYLQNWGGVNGVGADGGVLGRILAGEAGLNCGIDAVLTALTPS